MQPGLRRHRGRNCAVAGHDPLRSVIAARMRAEDAHVAEVDAARTDLLHASDVDELVGDLGRLDVLVTCLRTRRDADFLDLDDDIWTAALDTNVKAAFFLSRAVARQMVDSGGGTIVHVCSSLGEQPAPQTAAFSASMAAVRLMSNVMALDLLPEGVRVCTVADDDPKNAAGSDEEDVAAAVAFCAADDASYVLGSTFSLRGPMPARR